MDFDRGQVMAQSMSTMEPAAVVVATLLLLIPVVVIFLCQTPSVFRMQISFLLMAVAGGLLVVLTH